MLAEERVISALFLLLRAGLWDRAVEENTIFPLSPAEWKQIYAWSQAHTIQGIVFDGMSRLEAAHQAPKELYIQWMVLVEKIALRNRQMNEVLVKQSARFAKQGIRPILLKGQYLASLYPNPLRRVCGDVDWFFDSATAFEAANTSMEALGVKLVRPTAQTANYTIKGIEMDHHQQLFDIYNPFVRTYLKKLQEEAVESDASLPLGSAQIKTLPPVLSLLQVNAHILKHLLSFGIGLRQFCDAARLYYSNKGQYEEKALWRMYKRVGICKWVQVLHELLHRHLGLEATYLPGFTPGKESAQWMLAEVLQAGNFGFHDARYKHAELAGERVAVKKRVAAHVWQYLPYAPWESLSFPIIHFIERFKKS